MSTLQEGNMTPPSTVDVIAGSRAQEQDLPTHSPSIVQNNFENNQLMTSHSLGESRISGIHYVMLYGTPIVALNINGQERLCLAQICRTLLKDFSYNEIHNRRVALGIICVRCTPIQLELLRRIGAMPKSSKRCGMISKREAERLCKSFFMNPSLPEFPEGFYFDVYHQCGWGCRGSFFPSRYNNSRAKCIKCNFCNLLFSPNKFIFHSHRSSESTFNQPDSNSFNFWRKHIMLWGLPQQEIRNAWEDIKAMFNTGTRKRLMDASLVNVSWNTNLKRPRLLRSPAEQPLPMSSTNNTSKFPSTAGVSFPNRNHSIPPVPSLISINPPFGFHDSKLLSTSDSKQYFSELSWMGKQNLPISYGPMFWPHKSSFSLSDCKDNGISNSGFLSSLALNTQAPLLSSASDKDLQKSKFEMEPTQLQVKSVGNADSYNSAFRFLDNTRNKSFQKQPFIYHTTVGTDNNCGKTSDIYKSGSSGSALTNADVLHIQSNRRDSAFSPIESENSSSRDGSRLSEGDIPTAASIPQESEMPSTVDSSYREADIDGESA